MSDFLFTFFYRYVGYPLLTFVFCILSLVNKKISQGIVIRRKDPWLNFDKDLSDSILIHCASGEFEYAKAVIREFKKSKPSQKIVVTYFSPTYEKQIKTFEGIDFSCPLPWDCASTQKKFLQKLKPSKILIARTDLWPEFLIQANQLNIPVSLFSATLSSQSSKLKNILIKKYSQWVFSKLTRVFCVTDDDKKNFCQIFSTDKISVIGDTRYDQVVYRIEHPKLLKNSLIPKHKTFCIGSSWHEDQDVLLPIFSDLLKNFIGVMIAPHEPTPSHLKTLENQLTSLGLDYILYSKATEWRVSQILIIDQVGILADLYGWAQWAFVGGSFKKSVHSVMEPLAHGCMTFFGPHHTNNREALQFKIYDGCAFSVNDGKEVLTKILASSNSISQLQQKIQNLVRSKTNASYNLTKML